MKVSWTRKTARFTNGEIGTRKSVTLFEINYASLSKSTPTDAPRWNLTCNLPNVRRDLGNFATVELAKEQAEKAFDFWLNLLDLQEKNPS